jgi:uncharacterized protein
LLDERWCRFLHENKFLLGISIDGPKEFHDRYRVDGSGAGTFDRVFRGIQCCRKYQVEFNTLVLLNRINVEHPDRLFEFLLENDWTYAQFIPCVEIDPATGGPADFSITPQQYGDFLCRLFDLWVEHGPEKMNIREFDSLVTYYVLGHHTICAYSRRCEGFVVIEHSGDAFCCEFFVEPKWRLGNVLDTPLGEMAASTTKRQFARDKERLHSQCLVCRHLDVCRGGCMKDQVRQSQGGRFKATDLGDGPRRAPDCPDAAASRKSYFCESYLQFFDYALGRFRQIAAAVEKGTLRRRTRSAKKVRLQID